MEMFVPHDAEATVLNDVVRTMRAMPAVASVEVLDGATVLRTFRKDVGIADATLDEVMHPPTLVRSVMRPAFVSSRQMAAIAEASAAAFPMVGSAYWSQPYVQAVERRRADILVMGSVALALSAVMFVLAIFYAFRAELHEADRDLQVGVLLGATSSFIATPHILVSSLAGFVGLVLAAATLAGSWTPLLSLAPWLSAVQPLEVGMVAGVLAVTGLLLCWWQSVVTVARRARLARAS
jgi:cell division protein FtsX